jgi:glycosyltransferase involved in cell wall biosynthesis
MPMRVAFVTQPYDGVLPPRQNSIGLIVYNTALEVARNADVTVYVREGVEDDAVSRLPFSVAQTRSKHDDLLLLLNRRYPRWARRFGLDVRADAYLGWASAVAQRLRIQPVDVVHVMNYWGWSERLGGRPIVLEMQSEWLSQMPRLAVAAQLEHVSAIVAVSSHVERLFMRSFPEYAGEVLVAHNGVDPGVFTPPTSAHRAGGERTVLFVGRLSPEKGIHALLEAFAAVARRFTDVHLDLVGPRTELPRRFLVDVADDPNVRALERFYSPSGQSTYQGDLDAVVKRHGLEDRVTFHGALPHHDIVGLYQRSTLVVNPSLSETFGISIVEAMASGVPVVGTQVGGMLDTVSADVGFLVPPEDPSALADAMNTILGDASLSRELGTNGRKRAVEQFTWRSRAAKLTKLYERVAAKA